RDLQRRAAVAADPHPAAVVQDGVADPGGPVALRADEHDLADVERHRDVEDPALLDLRHPVGLARGLARLLMALADVDALDHDRDPAFGRAATVHAPER